MGSSMLQKHTSHDFKFDSFKNRICAFDGCRIVLNYTNPEKHQVLNDRRYCSLDCLKKQYSSLSFEGAIHLVHQVFGPEHPVTKVIQKMRHQHKINNKFIDAENRRIIGKNYEDANFKRLCHMTEKCL